MCVSSTLGLWGKYLCEHNASTSCRWRIRSGELFSGWGGLGIMSSILFLNCMATDSAWHVLHFSMAGERSPDRKNGTYHKTQLHECADHSPSGTVGYTNALECFRLCIMAVCLVL
jgi:hypothetical protein